MGLSLRADSKGGLLGTPHCEPTQWRISPRWGCQLSRGRQHTILLNFPKNWMKLKEFGPGGGGARPSRNMIVYGVTGEKSDHRWHCKQDFRNLIEDVSLR